MTATRALVYGVRLGSDPYFANVSLLAHFNGSNGSTTFTNNGNATPSSATIQAGSPVIDTSQSVFGGASIHFPNSSGIKWATTSPTNGLAFGTGDFTIEFRFRIASNSVSVNFYDGRVGNGDGNPVISMTSGGKVSYFTNGANKINSTTTVTINTWTAVALCRISGTSRLFIDGTQEGGNFTDANNINTANLFNWIAFNGAGASNNGNIDELRVTKGVGRYASNYTLDTAAFTNQ